MVPTLEVLQALGGSGTIREIEQNVAEWMNLTDEVLETMHLNTSQREVDYRLAWARTYLKKVNLIDNSSRGVWSLVDENLDIASVNTDQIVELVRSQQQSRRNDQASIQLQPELEAEGTEISDGWNTKLHQKLLSLPPDAFERLSQRLLRESGFVQVEVTGRSGDGGIDGIGIARIAGFLSFHVLFQCKRYQGAISPSQIRDFRGAMQGRTDKGLFITTGTFTREAMREASRDGAPPIDLLDGEQLVLRLKELGLGVKIRQVEVVEIEDEWFTRL